MVMQRGLESWRKMSRFRRQSQIKPMAAEVLEPRCLLTDTTGTLAVADAAPHAKPNQLADARFWS